MVSTRRAINTVLGLTIIGGVSYVAYIFGSGEGRLREICSRIQPGMSIDSLRAFALSHGMGPSPKEEGTSFIVESKTFGRFGCEVEVVAGQVKTVEYHFAD